MRALLVTILCSVVVGVGCGGGNANDRFDAPPCSDGVDNDGDGAIDFPDDLGCVSPEDDTENSPTSPQCDDGRDNDGDGKADYPNDPGCFAPQSDSEEDDCPDGPFCPQCGNGIDDDMNGTTDYPLDPGCESAADSSEFVNNPVACGPNMKIKQLPTTGMDQGMLDEGSTSTVGSQCGGGGGAPAIAYIFHLTTPKVIVASTDDSGTTADTVLDIRSAQCSDPSSEIACSDDIDGDNRTSMLTQSLQPGTYYLIVSGHDTGESGSYTLYVQLFNGEGTPCANQDDCGPGLLCRQPIDQSETVCAQPACNDGLDDDGDGKIDYPNDPGCASPNGNNETDNCPGPGGCPECANTLDDDDDGMIDYPADTTCKAAGDSSESCVTTEGVELIIQRTTTGTTVGSSNDFNPTCDFSTGAAPDKHFRLDLPAMTSLTINTTGFDVVQQLLDESCTANAHTCQDPSQFTTGALAAGTYYLVVDGYFTTSQGAYTIDVTGKIANGQPCDNSPLLQSGALTCNPGFACKGSPGSKTCQVAECNDGIDNNNNGGKKDYPQDPGCDSISDDSETTVCPGASCPACSDGQDNDGDGQIDYPNDTSCVAASGTSETCVSTEGTMPLTAPATMGDTSSATDDIKLSCASSTSTAKDHVYEVQLPAMQTVTFNVTSSFDAVYALLPSTCQNPSLTCGDLSPVTQTNLAAGTYFFVVDGWSTGSGTYTVNVNGTIADGERCDSPLATSGAITCSATHSCQPMGGQMRCLLGPCADGIDNNGNGKADYPNDPGCTSPADPTEDTVCPGGMCPVCANGVDDDGDGQIDFVSGGGDIGCSSASAMTEGFCPGEPDFGGVITQPATNSTLAGISDNYDQTCQTNTGNDRVFSLQLPVPVASLVIDTVGSTAGDLVASFKDASCGTQLACADDTVDLQPRITATNVQAGNYAIQVDSYSTSNNLAFVLNVKGTVAPQTACTSPLFTSGVLVCPTGTSCTAGKCQ